MLKLEKYLWTKNLLIELLQTVLGAERRPMVVLGQIMLSGHQAMLSKKKKVLLK